MQLFSADPIVFLCTGPAAQTAQKQKYRTTKSPLMQDWVFRLGLECLVRSNGEKKEVAAGLSLSGLLQLCA